MKRFFFLFFSFLLTGLYAQNFDDLLTKKINCSDISLNASIYFVKYMQENKLDSVSNLLNYWEEKCGIREPVYRAKILLSLKKGEFKDELINDENALYFIFNYRNRILDTKAKSSNYEEYPYYGYIPLGGEFDKYTKEEAKKLKSKYNENTQEYLLCEFYGDNSDTISYKLQEERYRNTKISKEYYSVINEVKEQPSGHFAGIAGIWIPTGDMKQVGNHCELGMQLGVKHKKLSYDIQ